jgi:iron complex outermembrane receptor protein
MKRLAVVLALLALGAAEPPADDTAPEDESPQESGVEERVEVQAEAAPADDVAASTTTIEGDEISRRGEDLGSVLRRVPGARVNDYGGLGRYATVSLRSSTAEQVTVLVDGIPQNRALGGPVDLSFVPATQISQVTVFRGFGSASLGLGGLGGVVDIRTRAPTSEPAGSVDLIAGQLGTTRLATGWSMRAGERAAVRVGAEALTSDGDFAFLDTGQPFDPADSVVRVRENNDVRQSAVLVQGVVQEAAGGVLRLATRLQGRERGVPGIDGLPAERTRLAERFGDLNAGWATGRGGPFDGIELLADYYEQRIEFEDLDGELGVGVQDQTTWLQGAGVVALLRKSSVRNAAMFRVETRRETVDVEDRALATEDRGGADRGQASVTVEDVVALGRVTLAPAVRWQVVRDDFRAGGEGTVPPPASDRENGDWSGKLGVAWAVSPSATVRASAGRFHRDPSLLELFGDRGAVVGNPRLVPESGWVAEAGATYAHERSRTPWSVELVAFGRDVEDLIVLQPNSQATSVPRNLLSATVCGLEGSFAARLPAGFALDASGTLRRSEDTSGGPGDGKSILYEPDRLGYLGVSWSGRRLRSQWDVTYVGENRAGFLAGEWLPSRVIHDVMFGWDAPAGWSMGIDARNVLDRETRDVARYPLPGRTLFVHIGWTTGGGGTP